MPVTRPSDQHDATMLAVHGVALASRTIERRLEGMSFAQMRILSLIARDPMRASELADGAALSRPTLSGLLDGLAAKGWIDRQAVEGDKRGVSLSITEAGTEALEHAHETASEALTELLDEIDDPDERANTLEALGALAGVAKKRLDRKLAARQAGAAQQ